MGRTCSSHTYWHSARYRRVNYDTIKVRGLFAFHMHSANTLSKRFHSRHSWWPPIIIVLLCWLSSRQPILPRPHHPRPDILLRLPSQVAEREPGLPIRQTTPERGSASPIGHNRSPTSPASSRTASTTISEVSCMSICYHHLLMLLFQAKKRPHAPRRAPRAPKP